MPRRKRKKKREWVETVSRTYGAVHMTLRIKKNGDAKVVWIGDRLLVSPGDRERAAHAIRCYLGMTHEQCYYWLWPLWSKPPEPKSERSGAVCLS